MRTATAVQVSDEPGGMPLSACHTRCWNAVSRTSSGRSCPNAGSSTSAITRATSPSKASSPPTRLGICEPVPAVARQGLRVACTFCGTLGEVWFAWPLTVILTGLLAEVHPRARRDLRTG